MKSFPIFILLCLLPISDGWAQAHQPTPESGNPTKTAPSSCDEDRQQLSSDVQQLKVLVNQMRTNLGLVQLSPSPLKHQFELEADAWQVIIKQMEQRLEKMECRDGSSPQG